MASASTLSSSFSPFETNTLRDDSFSSYLALIRQSFSTDLAANPNSPSSSFQTIAPPKRTSKDNGEIDVFTAEKYFSASLDVQDYPDLVSETTKSSRKSNNKKSCTKSRSSTCSEMSANSSSILLHSGRPPQSLPLRRNLLDLFRCSCLKKKAVEVEEEADERRFPVTRRKSLHSESSSDLFEIDSTSMNSSLPAAYEPSEASIEWSVATRSAANFSVESGEGIKARRSSGSGILRFGCVRDKAVSVTGERMASLERYHVMMDLGPAGVAGTLAARPRRVSLG